jgi:2,5-diketo-D-gluconate reductase B
MRYETLGDLRIPKLGFGTWKVGGSSVPDPAQEQRSLAGLRSALELGYRHFDTAEHYAEGRAEELLGQALVESSVPRAELFIASKVWPNHLRYDDLLKSFAGSLRRLRLEYLDLYLVHWPNESVPLPETFRAFNQLVREGRVRHIGVSNFTLRGLKQARHLAETPLFTDQVSYSLEDRTPARNGVLAYCQENNILLTAYSPVEGGRLRLNERLRTMAEAHGCTPYQLALAWLVAQPRVIAIPMSLDPAHQAENLAATDLDLSPAELEELNRF